MRLSEGQAAGAGMDAASDRFDQMSRRLRPALLRYFWRRTGGQADAEELVQELFLRLLRREDLFELDNPDGYIFEAAANLLRDTARRQAARAHNRHDDVTRLSLCSDEPSPEQNVADRLNLQQILQALDDLPERTRTVLILARFEDLSYAQIATAMGLSVSAVEKHMMRALKALRSVKSQ